MQQLDIFGPSKHVLVEKKSEYVPDFKKLSEPELLEVLERQNKIINSRAVTFLKDKGEKVKHLKKQIEEEIERRKKAEDICNKLINLSINEQKVEVVEWGDKAKGYERKDLPEKVFDDESNPLVLIATHSGTIQHKHLLKVEEPEAPLITLADIEEAYALTLCSKIDKALSSKDKFLPHRTLKSKQDINKQNKVRDLSAATPPPPRFGDTKLITLEESIKLQYEQTRLLKEVQLKHATERLRESQFRMGSYLPPEDSMATYREQNCDSEEDSETIDE